MKPLKNLIAFTALLAGLGAIFSMYGQPDFLFIIANQVWGCF